MGMSDGFESGRKCKDVAEPGEVGNADAELEQGLHTMWAG